MAEFVLCLPVHRHHVYDRLESGVSDACHRLFLLFHCALSQTGFVDKNILKTVLVIIE